MASRKDKRKAKALLKRQTRTPGQRVKGVVQRIGGVAAGQDPSSAAPRTLPRGVKPRVKPRGNTTGANGKPQLNPNFGQTPKPVKKKKKKKKKR